MVKNISKFIIGLALTSLFYCGLRQIPFNINNSKISLANVSAQISKPSKNFHYFNSKNNSNLKPDVLGLNYEDVQLKTVDNVKLSGFYIPSETNKAILLLHGYKNNKSDMLRHSKFLNNAGYNTLCFDFRAQGKSEGKYISYGNKEKLDVNAGIKYLKTKGMEKICVLGTSLGGSIGLISAKENKSIDAIITDGAYASFHDTIKYQIKKKTKDIPNYIINPLIYLTLFDTTVSTGINYFNNEPIKHIKGSSLPILMIHGNKDRTIPKNSVHKISNIVNNSETLILKNKYHCSYLVENIQGYEPKILEFLKKNL